jgi:hypothetical protein
MIEQATKATIQDLPYASALQQAPHTVGASGEATEQTTEAVGIGIALAQATKDFADLVPVLVTGHRECAQQGGHCATIHDRIPRLEAAIRRRS